MLAVPMAVNIFIATDKLRFMLNYIGVNKKRGMHGTDRKQVHYAQNCFQE